MILLFKRTFIKRNNIFRTTFLLLLLILAIKQGKTQDVKLTQFNYSPLLLNPAHSGNFYGDWRAGLNFRNQWAGTGAAYNTAVFSGDKLFNFYNQKIGTGALVVSDQSEGLNRTKVYISGSYFYDLNENHFSFGLQPGMVFSSPNNPDFKNYNPITDQNDQPNGESATAGNGSYLDINVGLLWFRQIGIFEPEVGASYSHLNSPNESLLSGSTSKVNPTTKIHASVKTKLSDEIYILPTAFFANNNGNTASIIGTDIGYNLLGNRSSVKRIYGGLYISNGITSELNDFSILLGTTIGRIDVALNYDINLTSMSKSESVTSFEISLIYKSISTVLNSYSIPCERF